MTHILGFIVGVISSVVGAILVRFVVDRYSLHISFRRILKSIVRLQRLIQADGYVPDYIVGIDRNGSVVASILSGHIGIRPIIVAVTRTIHHVNTPREVQLSPDQLPGDELFANTKILIVCCYVDTGSALEVVYKHFADLPRPPSDIRTAALYTTRSPRLKPKYFVYEIGRDVKASIDQIIVKMPWITDEWKLAPRGKSRILNGDNS
jgi:hypoxanthine phosphoribosyltransferase